MWRPALSSLVVLTVLVAGCTGEEATTPPPDVDEDAVRTGLAQLYAGDHAEDAEDAGDADTDAADCFARGLVEATTPDQLREAGLLDASYAVVDQVPPLPQDAAEAWVDAQLACVDFVEESARAQVAASKGAIDPATYATCLRAAITEDQLRAALVQALTGDLSGPAVARLSDAQVSCATAPAP